MKTLKEKAKDLAWELLGGIEYGDDRDNPKWQEAVLKAATIIILEEFEAIKNEEKKQKKNFKK